MASPQMAAVGRSLAASVKGSYPELLLAGAFLLLLLFRTRQQKGRVQSSIPTNWPVVGMLPGLMVRLRYLYDFLHMALAEAGGTIEFRGPWGSGMNFLCTADPANSNHVFNANFANFPKGEEYLEIFDIFGGGIFNADHDSWRAQRRMAHALLSEPRFRGFVVETSREKVRNSVFPLFKRAAESGQVLDLQDMFLRFTFDVTCTLVMGADLGCLSPGLPTVPFAKAMDEALEALLYRHTVPTSWWKLMRRLRLGTERTLAVAWETMDRFIDAQVSKKREEIEAGSESPDLLTSYMKGRFAEEHGAVGGLLDFHSGMFLRDTVVSLMLAGRDAVALTMTWLFWLLSQHPDVEAKVLEELRADRGASGTGVFDPEGVSSLVYLHACLCETMRLYPPIPFEHKGVVESDVLPSGHRVDPGTKILFSLYAMGRMESAWGKDCLEFRPERWVSENGRIRHEPSYKFLVFNSGPRTCLGKDMSFTSMKVVAATVLYNFKVEVVEDHEVAPRASITLHMKNGMMVNIKKRRDF